MGKVKKRMKKTASKANAGDKPGKEAGVTATTGKALSKLEVDLNTLEKQLGIGGDGEDMDARSAITSRSMKGLNLKKKEKRGLKKSLFKKRIDVITSRKKELKKRSRRKPKRVTSVENMSNLKDALDLLMKDMDDTKTKKEEKKMRPVQKYRQRKKNMLKDIDVFKQVLNHPEYKKDPLAVLSEHLHNKIKQEEEMDT